ncbi:hypothetical protein JL720_15929 [Aureococcus anophagefferens]|nr:hypothetical protein JL720_15929 [Aureococcus anophagefferens]
MNVCVACAHRICDGPCPLCRAPPLAPEAFLAAFRRRAGEGSAAALYQLGQVHRWRWAWRAAPRAVELTAASDLGDVEATVALAYALHVGDGVARDDERALELCRAATGPPAQCDYGTTLYERREFEAAFAYYVHSAHQGFTLAEFYVGRYLHLGLAVDRDLEATKRWYERAAAKGHGAARNSLRDLTEGRREVTRTELEVSAALAAEAFDRAFASTRAELEAELAATADDAEVARAANAALAEEAPPARRSRSARKTPRPRARRRQRSSTTLEPRAANAPGGTRSLEAASVALAERAEDAEAARAANAALVDDAGAARAANAALRAELAASEAAAAPLSAEGAEAARAAAAARSSTTREPRVQRTRAAAELAASEAAPRAERAEDAEAALGGALRRRGRARAAAEAARAALTQDHACDLEVLESAHATELATAARAAAEAARAALANAHAGDMEELWDLHAHDLEELEDSHATDLADAVRATLELRTRR